MTDAELRRIREAEREAGFAEGYAAAERDLLPFHGVDRVTFARDRPHFAACVLYEDALLARHRWVLSLLETDVIDEQRAREHVSEMCEEGPQLVAAAAARGSNRVASTMRRLAAGVSTRSRLQEAQDAARESWEKLDAHERLAKRLVGELHDVRAWLDDHVDEASEYAAEREGRRRETDPLYEARVFADRSDFVAGDRGGREGGMWPGEDRPGGDSYGEWTWEDPDRPWLVRPWAVSWLDNGEIYAWHRTYCPDPELVPHARGGERADEPVLLLGCVPRARSGSADDFLGRLQREVTGRNTLVALARAVAEQERVLQRRNAAADVQDRDASSAL
jgi:hypothetical protein